MIVIDICLSDIPKDAITEGKNGKKYLKLVLNKRKSEGKFGETHTLQLSQTKEQREAKAAPVYVGGGKEYQFSKTPENAPVKSQSTTSTGLNGDAAQMFNDQFTDLPF
jgi:hypothetical protein